jgi:hypothetical protein
MEITQNQHTKEINLKALKTGRSRKWDARLTPQDTALLWEQEKAKARWLAHVAVLENGDILSGTTPTAEAAQLFADSRCDGFVGALWTDKERRSVQFFVKELRVGREARARLQLVVERLGKQVEGALEKDLK